MILDGFGINPKREGNAVKLAHTPNIDKLKKEYPTTQIEASGKYVGLPDGQMGNSEVGHTNIGAGRIVYQDLTRITNAINDGSFYTNDVLEGAIKHCQQNNTNLHILGLVSDGGVHSHINHLFALLELAKRNNFKNVYVHAFLDGRDTAPNVAYKYIQELEKVMQEKQVGKIASISGRFYSMDRDKRWERVQKSYDMLVNGIGKKSSDATFAIKESYQDNIFDEFILPTIISEDDKIVTINNNDAVIFFNFRQDRVREITRALVDPEFEAFPVKKLNLYYVCFTEYDKTMPNVKVAFKLETLHNTLGEIVSTLGFKQLRIAETEKYAHVTFFFNGGEEKQYPGEDRILVPSPKVRTYDLKPEMSAYEVTDKVIEMIKSDKYDMIILNYANTDMVGHTGSLEAAIKAVETVDECLGKVVSLIKEKDANLIITADHGNAEQMINYETGEPHTAHTINPVPVILVTKEDYKLKENGKLADLAPTMLDLMKIDKPEEMNGNSLLLK